MRKTCLCALVCAATCAQPQSLQFAPAGQLYLLKEGPTSQNARIVNLGFSDLHYYPNVDLSPNYSVQNQDPYDERVFINLVTDSYVVWDQPPRPIGLPRSTTAVFLHVKLKAHVKRAEWDGLGDPPPPAYAQCDLSASRGSDLPTDKTDLTGFLNFTSVHNHSAHIETPLYMPWDQELREVRYCDLVVPVSYNAQGEPCIGFIFNYGIMNKDPNGNPSATYGTSRGVVEATLYLAGYYAPAVKTVSDKVTAVAGK